MILTPDEIKTLTDREVGDAQRRELDHMRGAIPSADGSPIVLWHDAEHTPER